MFLAQRGKPAAFAAARQHLTPHAAAALQVSWILSKSSCSYTLRLGVCACVLERLLLQPLAVPSFPNLQQLAIQHLMATQTAQAVLPAVTLRPIDGPVGGARSSGRGGVGRETAS